MRNYTTLRIIVTILIASLLIGFIYVGVVRSQRALPGTGPLKNETDAIAVALTVANINSTSRDPDKLVLKTVIILDLPEFQVLQKDKQINVDPSALINIEESLGSSKFIWMVTFQGSFSPLRHPPGVTPSVYSLIDIFLDERDGSVIGLHMHD